MDVLRLTVPLNHWKSQLGKKDESDGIRRNGARAVRECLDHGLTVEASAAILVSGDFDDASASPILTEPERSCTKRRSCFAYV